MPARKCTIYDDERIEAILSREKLDRYQARLVRGSSPWNSMDPWKARRRESLVETIRDSGLALVVEGPIARISTNYGLASMRAVELCKEHGLQHSTHVFIRFQAANCLDEEVVAHKIDFFGPIASGKLRLVRNGYAVKVNPWEDTYCGNKIRAVALIHRCHEMRRLQDERARREEQLAATTAEESKPSCDEEITKESEVDFAAIVSGLFPEKANET
jgi:hypothetical protein